MHELGIMIHIVEQVVEIAKENNLTQVEKLVLQIGELSSVVPQFIEACYPAAIDGTMLEQTRLEIEMLPANGLCKGCGKVYNLPQNQSTCPACGSGEAEVLGGTEFMIKEIVAC